MVTGQKQVKMGKNNNPTGKGGWEKGKSGNPNGRPKTPAEVKEAFQGNGADAWEKIVYLLNNSPNESIQFAAAKEILDRAYGKSQQQMDVKTEVSAPVTISFDGDLEKWSK